MKEKEVIIIGIAGGSCSGKSTLIQRIQEEFKQDVAIISHDYYYKSYDEIDFEQRKQINYDHPDAFDTELLIEHIKELKQWKKAEVPVYDFNAYCRTEKTKTVMPSKVIIIEGILLFENKELRDMFDIKVFVDADADVRVIRRILRDAKERGRSLESVIDQYMNSVKAMHERYVEPSKKYADIIVPQGGHNQVAFQMLTHRIRALLG